MKLLAVLLTLVVLSSCQTTAPAPESRAQIDSLEAQLADLKLRALELEKEIDSHKAGTGALTETRDQLVRDRDSLLGKTALLENQLNNLEVRAATLLAEKARLTQQLEELGADNALLASAGKATKSELQQAIEKALAERQQAEAQLSRLQTERDALALQLKQESDRLDAAVTSLRQALNVEISRGNLEVLRYQNVLVVNIKDSLLFGADSPVLKPDYKATLATIAGAFQQFPDKVIRVEGHTAVAPSRWSSSWDLGAARAVSVVRYLQDEQKIDPSRLVALSFGEFRPLTPNGTEAGRALNRRVELVLVDRPLYQVQELLQSSGK